MQKETIVVVIFLFIAGIVLGTNLHNWFKNKKSLPLTKLKEYMNSDEISDGIKEIICNIIEEIDFSKYNSFDEAQTELFTTAYNQITKYLEVKLSTKFGDDKLYKSIMKLLTESFVEDYVNTAMLSDNIQQQINDIAQYNIDNSVEDVISKEMELEESYKKYENMTDNTIEELDPTLIDGKTGDKNLNPPKDEEDFSDDDESVEVIE